MCKEFTEMMGNEFEMSMMGELNFFFGLQIKQTPTETMIHQQKYIKELLKKFNMDSSKCIDTPIAICGIVYKISGKSQRLSSEEHTFSWFFPGVLGTKKQNSVALSTAEGEYVAVASCCAQLLWI
ncbi:uncharacterized protein [Nicotiana tomentosiformis]|uniref:uncharacterized protein n=1 Tax=Nicotiana tomentosiformis TaxID=4098 RepID=UPI00388CC35B